MILYYILKFLKPDFWETFHLIKEIIRNLDSDDELLPFFIHICAHMKTICVYRTREEVDETYFISDDTTIGLMREKLSQPLCPPTKSSRISIISMSPKPYSRTP